MKKIIPHTEICPYCKHKASAKWTTVDLCFMQITPFKCENCGAKKLEPGMSASKKEKTLGWKKGEQK